MSGGGPQRKRPAKQEDPLGKARKCLKSGRYRDTRHVAERQDGRGISLPEVEMIIEKGHWEKKKDEYFCSHCSLLRRTVPTVGIGHLVNPRPIENIGERLHEERGKSYWQKGVT